MKFLIVFAMVFISCAPPVKETKAKPAPAAKVENRVKESDLTLITLSPDAEKRLGIELAAVSERSASNQIIVAGEIIPIPGNAIIVTSPASGAITGALNAGQQVNKGDVLFRLTPMVAPQRDVRVTFAADLQSAKARLDNAAIQLDRARQLLRDLAGSQRNVDTADQEFGMAKAAHDVAAERLKRFDANPLDADIELKIVAPSAGIVRQVLVSNGQVVTAGAMLFEVADLTNVWFRIAVYAPDVKEIAALTTIDVRDLDGAGPILKAHRVSAPPTADPLAATTDLYFALPNPALQLHPGQRLSASLPTRPNARKGLSVPLSAILYDIHGGVWVYVHQAPLTYRRQRVELLETAGQIAYLSRGVKAGMNVVTQGAAELFGTEFGAGR